MALPSIGFAVFQLHGLGGSGLGVNLLGLAGPRPALPDPDRLFHLAGNLVLPGWLLLLFAPGWRWTQRYTAFAVPLLLASAYGLLLLAAHPPPGAGFGSLHAVGLLFSSPEALLAGWLHYLAFDLFTGSWQAREAVQLRISRWIVAPCLVLTFLLGPLGLALFLLIRLGMRRQVEP